jgi:hypothetical protein
MGKNDTDALNKSALNDSRLNRSSMLMLDDTMDNPLAFLSEQKLRRPRDYSDAASGYDNMSFLSANDQLQGRKMQNGSNSSRTGDGGQQQQSQQAENGQYAEVDAYSRDRIDRKRSTEDVFADGIFPYTKRDPRRIKPATTYVQLPRIVFDVAIVTFLVSLCLGTAAGIL